MTTGKCRPTGQKGDYIMDREPVVTVEKTIGDTVYIVEYTVSENAKESAYDKIRKLILNDSGTIVEKAVS